MIDTGSTISAINASYFKKLNYHQRIVPSKKSCKTANNTCLNINGMVTLPIKINDVYIPMNIFIIKDLCADSLLGGDFCDKGDVDISYSGKYLVIKTRHQQTRVKFLQEINKNQIFYVTAMHDIKIPSLSSKVIRSATSSPAMSAIFTPSSKVLNEQQVVAPHAILTINNDKTTILTLLSTTTSVKIISKGTNLGYVRCYRNGNCGRIYSDSTQNQDHISTISSRPAAKKTTTALNNNIYNMVRHLPYDQQQQIYSVLNKHKCVFDNSTPSIMKTNNVYHRIPIPSHHQPIQSYPYRKSAKETEIINQQVKEMLANHVVRPSSSPWSSPVVIINKKDGTPRFCVDYRKLNLITECDVYPLPRIDDLIDKLAGSQYFTTFDLKAGYWQVSIAEQDKKKTVFVTTDGLFEFNVLPFGLSNAPATFQRIINSVLGALRWDLCLVYLDDIIVFISILKSG